MFNYNAAFKAIAFVITILNGQCTLSMQQPIHLTLFKTQCCQQVLTQMEYEAENDRALQAQSQVICPRCQTIPLHVQLVSHATAFNTHTTQAQQHVSQLEDFFALPKSNQNN